MLAYRRREEPYSPSLTSGRRHPKSIFNVDLSIDVCYIETSMTCRGSVNVNSFPIPAVVTSRSSDHSSTRTYGPYNLLTQTRTILTLPISYSSARVGLSNLSVCLEHNQKRMIPKCSNLVQGMTLGCTRSDMVWGSKGQGHTVNNTTKSHFISSNNRASMSFARWRYWRLTSNTAWVRTLMSRPTFQLTYRDFITLIIQTTVDIELPLQFSSLIGSRTQHNRYSCFVTLYYVRWFTHAACLQTPAVSSLKLHSHFATCSCCW